MYDAEFSGRANKHTKGLSNHSYFIRSQFFQIVRVLRYTCVKFNLNRI